MDPSSALWRRAPERTPACLVPFVDRIRLHTPWALWCHPPGYPRPHLHVISRWIANPHPHVWIKCTHTHFSTHGTRGTRCRTATNFVPAPPIKTHLLLGELFLYTSHINT